MNATTLKNPGGPDPRVTARRCAQHPATRTGGSARRWIALLGLATALTAAGCSSEAGDAATGGNAKSSGGGMAYADAGGGGQFSGGGGGGAADYDDEGMGIGLKPGGDQDIGFFRALVEAGQLPEPGDMSIEGWLNEHDTQLPSASPDRTIDLHALAAVHVPADSAAPAEAVVQLGMNSASSLAAFDAKVALCLVVDVSGSMGGGKLGYVKTGLQELVGQLPERTSLSIHSFSSEVSEVWKLAAFEPSDKGALLAAVNAMAAGGGTNLHGGLEAGINACQLADPSHTYRHVVVLSDGEATEGNTSTSAMLGLADDAEALGLTVSSIGVGTNYDKPLMSGLAQKGGGTAWFLHNAAKAKEVFLQDLETLLLPVAENVWFKLELGGGWGMSELYGFEWVEKDGEIIVLGPKGAEVAQPTPGEPGADAGGGGDAGANVDPDNPPSALPTVYASKKNGMIMVHLAPPQGFAPGDVSDLLLATVKYGYTLSKSGETQSFEVPVQVPGLTQLSDGGLAYFGSPIVRRSYALLQAGLALIEAIALFHGDSADVAQAEAVLDAAFAYVESEHVGMGAAALADVDPDNDLAATLEFLVQVKALIGAQPADGGTTAPGADAG